MSLFGADQVYTCLEKVYMVYTGLPPDGQAGKLTRAYLRNAGTYWSYERALLYRIPSWSSACHSRDKKVQLPLCW